MLSFSGSLKVFVAVEACDTLIECCRRRGFDPFAYLRAVLTRLPTMTNRQIPEVTPTAWFKNQKQLQTAS